MTFFFFGSVAAKWNVGLYNIVTLLMINLHVCIIWRSTRRGYHCATPFTNTKTNQALIFNIMEFVVLQHFCNWYLRQLAASTGTSLTLTELPKGMAVFSYPASYKVGRKRQREEIMSKQDWWTQINPSQTHAIRGIQICIWCISHWLFPLQTETRLECCEGIVKGISFDLNWIVEWSYLWLQKHLVFNWKLSEGIHTLVFRRIITEYWVESANIVSKISEIFTKNIITLFLSAFVILGKKLLSKSRNLPCYAPVISSLQLVFNTMSAEECQLTMTKQRERSLFFTWQNIFIFSFPHLPTLFVSFHHLFCLFRKPGCELSVAGTHFSLSVQVGTLI